MEDRSKVEQQLERKKVVSVCDHFKAQMNALPPSGEDVHRRGSPLHSFNIVASAIEENTLKGIETFQDLRNNYSQIYEGLINSILEANDRFGVYIPD